MEAATDKGIGNPGAQEKMEKTVGTVDFTSSAGQGQQGRSVEVVHQLHSPSTGSNTSGSILANAAASVESTLRSAEEAVSGK